MDSLRVRVLRALGLTVVCVYLVSAIISARTNIQLIFGTFQARLLDDNTNTSVVSSRASLIDAEVLTRHAEDANALDLDAGNTVATSRVLKPLLKLHPGRRIPGFYGLCALSNNSIADGCSLISVGKPISGYESFEWRARMMQGEWISLFNGAQHEGKNVCTTPLNCAMGNSTFVAVDIGVPGHGYCDIIRAVPYARASADPRCSENHITQVVRTQNKRGNDWHSFFLRQTFPEAKVRIDRGYVQGTPEAPHYPISSKDGACCATCVDPPDRSTPPFTGYSQSAYDHFRCSMWSRLKLQNSMGQSKTRYLLQVLVINRRGKRSWDTAQALRNLIEKSPALSKATLGSQDALRINVKSIYLERVKPQEQCKLFFSSHIIVAMHGSSLGNLLCSAPGSVAIEVFPPGFHLDMFGILAAASGVYNVHLLPDPYPNSTAVPMSRGFKTHRYPAYFDDTARDVSTFQPSATGLEQALAAASALLHMEATAGWPSFHSVLSSC